VSLPSQVSPPQIALADVAPTRVVPDLAGPFADDGLSLARCCQALDESTRIFALLEHAKATGKAGEVVEHVLLSRAGLSNGSLRSLLFVGVGDGTPVDLRRAGAAVARRAKGRETLATSIPALSDDAGLRAFVEGLVLGSFGFHRRSTGPKETPVARVVLAGLDDIGTRQVALDRALAVAGAGGMSRMMALVPSNEKNPVWMAERAEEIAKSAGLSIEVWDEKRLVAEGFGGIVGVGQASENPPRMVKLEYTPKKAGRKVPHVVLVGKGITFDTGGLSIARRRDDEHKARHDRRRRRPGGPRRAVTSTPSPGHRTIPCAELRERQRGRLVTCCGAAAAPARSPTPTPRAAWSWRRWHAVAELEPACSSTWPR
jgi:leucyl aminopeptidase